MSDLLIGRNPVMEALKSGRVIEKLLMQNGAEGSAKKIEALARERKISIQFVDRAALERITAGGSGGGNHQGVVAYVSSYRYYEVEDLLNRAAEKGEDPFLLLLDGIEDPHNLGAILRSADGAGVHGVIIPKRRAVGLTEAVAKASAGAVEYVPVAKVSNLSQTIDLLKAKGVWVGACHMDGSLYYERDLTGPIVIVIGGEGSGVSRLVREKCDFILSIPMEGKVSSLNASNAATILMYEINRQRRGKL